MITPRSNPIKRITAHIRGHTGANGECRAQICQRGTEPERARKRKKKERKASESTWVSQTRAFTRKWLITFRLVLRVTPSLPIANFPFPFCCVLCYRCKRVLARLFFSLFFPFLISVSLPPSLPPPPPNLSFFSILCYLCAFPIFYSLLISELISAASF